MGMFRRPRQDPEELERLKQQLSYIREQFDSAEGSRGSMADDLSKLSEKVSAAEVATAPRGDVDALSAKVDEMRTKLDVWTKSQNALSEQLSALDQRGHVGVDRIGQPAQRAQQRHREARRLAGGRRRSGCDAGAGRRATPPCQRASPLSDRVPRRPGPAGRGPPSSDALASSPPAAAAAPAPPGRELPLSSPGTRRCRRLRATTPRPLGTAGRRR